MPKRESIVQVLQWTIKMDSLYLWHPSNWPVQCSTTGEKSPFPLPWHNGTHDDTAQLRSWQQPHQWYPQAQSTGCQLAHAGHTKTRLSPKHWRQDQARLPQQCDWTSFVPGWLWLEWCQVSDFCPVRWFITEYPNDTANGRRYMGSTPRILLLPGLGQHFYMLVGKGKMLEKVSPESWIFIVTNIPFQAFKAILYLQVLQKLWRMRELRESLQWDITKVTDGHRLMWQNW